MDESMKETNEPLGYVAWAVNQRFHVKVPRIATWLSLNPVERELWENIETAVRVKAEVAHQTAIDELTDALHTAARQAHELQQVFDKIDYMRRWLHRNRAYIAVIYLCDRSGQWKFTLSLLGYPLTSRRVTATDTLSACLDEALIWIKRINATEKGENPDV